MITFLHDAPNEKTKWGRDNQAGIRVSKRYKNKSQNQNPTN